MKIFLRSIVLLAVITEAVAAGAASSDADTVIVHQGQATVTLGDVDAFLRRNVPEENRAGFLNSPKRIESMLQGMLLQKQLAAEARTLKLDQEPVTAIESRQAEDEVLARARKDYFLAHLTFPDFSELAHEEYLGHQSDYLEHGRVDVKHILLALKQHKAEEAQQLATKVEQEARAKPEQFDALITQYSEDPSKEQNHGLMENAGSAKYDATFAEAAVKLQKPGDISPPVKSKYGYHILMLVKREPDHQKSFEEASDQIKAKLRKEYIDKQYRTHIDQLRNNKMDANPDVVASLRTRYMPTGASADKVSTELPITSESIPQSQPPSAQ